MATEKRQKERGDVIFANQLVTTADLEDFKSVILEEMRKMVKVGHGLPTKKWLKSSEVRKMLDISPGKLYWLRSSRQLEFMRIGGVIYYDTED
ncbi:MAG: helix-turn-helix domain-containing protein, partial [Dyadobacter sp.]